MSLSDTHKELFPNWPVDIPKPEELSSIPDTSEVKIVIKRKEFTIKNGDIMFIDKSTRRSIAAIVKYLVDDEKLHYEGLPKDERCGHVYLEILNIEKWLGNSKPKI